MQLVVQLVDLLFGSRKGAAAGRCNPVHAPAASARISKRFQQLGALQSVQQGIEGPRPDAVAMVRKFLHHRQPKDGLVGCVNENVNADEPVQQLSLTGAHRDHYNVILCLFVFNFGLTYYRISI
jgi:hypothetical protein